MAKVISKLKLSGTIDGITFYKCSDQVLAREKGSPGITKKQFAENPIYDFIKKQSSEFGYCVNKSRVFRQLAKPLFDRAKEVSFAGRVNQLLFEILEEDTLNPKGKRTLEQGLDQPVIDDLLLHFEGNKLRPLKRVLKLPVIFDWKQNTISLTSLHVDRDIVWPTPEANQVHIQVGIADWDYKNDSFEHHFSNEIVLKRDEDIAFPLSFILEPLSARNLWIAFLFIGFSNKERRKTKLLHKKWNTVTIIGVQK